MFHCLWLSTILKDIYCVEFKTICFQEYLMNAKSTPQSTNLNAEWVTLPKTICNAIEISSWTENGIASLATVVLKYQKNVFPWEDAEHTLLGG